MTTFLTQGPGTGVADLSRIGVPTLWTDGTHPPFRAVQCSRYIEVETVNGCVGAGVSDFVREVPGGLFVVRWANWTYAPVEQNPPPVPAPAVPVEVRAAPKVEAWDATAETAEGDGAVRLAPALTFPYPGRPSVEVPLRWRLERLNIGPLRALCDKAGVSHLGRRTDLINRLREYAAQTAAG